MADVKITEVQALEAVLEFAPTDEVREKLQHMINVRGRKRGENSAKRLANITLGEEFVEKWGDKGEFKASDVATTLGVSISKASAIAKAMNWVKVPSTEKVCVYSL